MALLPKNKKLYELDSSTSMIVCHFQGKKMQIAPTSGGDSGVMVPQNTWN